MPFPRPIDSTLHGVTDYTAGAIHAGYSTLTDYPLGAVKAIPYQAHLALDAIAAVALAATPFVTGQFRKGRRHWLPHVALGALELAALALTDPTGRGDYHGDVEAVRAANTESPQRKIRDRRPAVTPVAA